MYARGPASKLGRALQVALDTPDLGTALKLAECVAAAAEWIEVGTPLLLAEGLRILPAFRERCPNCLLLADTKIADAGYLEASLAFAQGADAITVLGVSDDLTVRGCIEAAREVGGWVFADLIHVVEAPARAVELEAMGVNVLCLHTAWDRRERGIEVLADLRRIRAHSRLPLAVAGGVTQGNCREVLEAGADILVVGGGITCQADPAAAANAFRHVLEQRP